MSGDQLNLDAIEARMAEWQHILDTGRYDEDLMGELAGDAWPLVECGRLNTETYQHGDSSTVRTTLRYYGQRIIDERPA